MKRTYYCYICDNIFIMIYILLSILCSAALVIILRLFSNYKINTTYGIVWNYLVCCLVGLFLMENRTLQIQQFIQWEFAYIPLLLGCTFYLIFSIVGKSTTSVGVATTGIAFKLSFVIPVLFAFFLYQDEISISKILGIVLAIIAIYFVSYDKETQKEKAHRNDFIYPLIIFIGGGLTDTVFNYIQKKLFIDGWEHIINISVFFGAFALSFVFNFYKKELYKPKNILGGIVLGIPNYGSLYFLLQALEKSNLESSKIFPINNIGIVCITAFVGIVLFNENFNFKKLLGIILAISSIILIGFL
jgi:drug/metabolite transporter (DMT)-like permease